MTQFHYIVKATQGDNVGIIEAESEEESLQKLDDIYTPNDAMRESPLITFELIDEQTYHTEQKRIHEQRLEEANHVDV